MIDDIYPNLLDSQENMEKHFDLSYEKEGYSCFCKPIDFTTFAWKIEGDRIWMGIWNSYHKEDLEWSQKDFISKSIVKKDGLFIYPSEDLTLVSVYQKDDYGNETIHCHAILTNWRRVND